MQKNKYVLDCNVYISAIINSKLEFLAEYILVNELSVFICDELENELIDVLARPHIKKYISNPIDSYLINIRLFTKHAKIKKKYSGSPDKKDDYLFALCLTCNAILVTGDKKLQRFAESPINVLTTTAFKQVY